MRFFKLDNARTVAGSGGVALALVAAMVVAVVAMMMTLAPQQSVAKPAYSQATGRPCTACHAPAPPKLNACGKKYAKDHKTKC